MYLFFYGNLATRKERGTMHANWRPGNQRQRFHRGLDRNPQTVPKGRQFKGLNAQGAAHHEHEIAANRRTDIAPEGDRRGALGRHVFRLRGYS